MKPQTGQKTSRLLITFQSLAVLVKIWYGGVKIDFIADPRLNLHLPTLGRILLVICVNKPEMPIQRKREISKKIMGNKLHQKENKKWKNKWKQINQLLPITS